MTFYEDFPYAWWNDFTQLEDLPPDGLRRPPRRTSGSMPEYADIGDQLERKITGINLYASQIDRLFTGTQEMARQVRAHAPQDRRCSTARAASAERYWSTVAS